MTALVIVISQQLIVDPTTGNYMLNEAGNAIATIDGNSGVALTSAAFASGISWFPYVLAIAVILFAFSTMISWSYYGLKAWTYLFGEGKGSELTFKIIFCVFIVIGAAATSAEDRIIYDSSTGNLFYDPDGDGAQAQVQFAQLQTGLALTAADFLIV